MSLHFRLSCPGPCIGFKLIDFIKVDSKLEKCSFIQNSANATIKVTLKHPAN